MSDDAPHLMANYARTDLCFTQGAGAWATASDGARYLDFGSGVAVNLLGHAHPKLIAALNAQAEKLWHVSNLYRIAEQEALAAQLCAVSFAERVFFCNSGAEAVEGVIKTARKYHATNGAPEKTTILTFKGAFHGRTLATLAAANNPAYLDGFGTPLQGFHQLEGFALDAVRDAITPDVAGILIEPIQGEGGVRDVPLDFLRGLRALCDEHKILLALDEVQCGMGRTGKLFAHEWAGITPDLMAVAKGIGGGFPLGAVLATEATATAMGRGTHGSTFGGNPLAMAVGAAVLEEVTQAGFLQQVTDSATLFTQKLSRIIDTNPDIFTALRGRGLMLGLVCAKPNADVIASLQAVGLLVVGAGENVIRLLPPLNVTQEELDYACDALEKACAALRENSEATQ